MSYKTKYNVFLAASMKLQEEKDCIEKYMTEESPLGERVSFKIFDYGHNEIQDVRENDAQEETNKKIKECELFFLIVDGYIGSDAKREFNFAYESLKTGGKPYHIFVFSTPAHTGKMTELLSSREYEEFEKFRTNTLGTVVYTAESFVQSTVCHPIPYNNLSDITKKIKEQLLKIDLPENGMKRGSSIVPRDFYLGDVVRENHCNPLVYFKRPVDEKLKEEIDNGTKYIYVTGPPLSGKTRSVFQAAKQYERGWFYIFSRNDALEKAHMLELTAYFQSSIRTERIYIVIDDVERILNDSIMRTVFWSLINVTSQRDVTFIFTSSYAPKEVGFQDFLIENQGTIIKIGVLSYSEFLSVNSFLVAHSQLDRSIMNPTVLAKCDTIGSMVIRIDKTKDDYQRFYDKAQSMQSYSLGWALLRSIKSMTIWHGKNVGSVDKIKEFCKYLLKSRSRLDEKNFENDFREAKNCLSKCYGITLKGDKLIVQDFVYRDVISFSGYIKKDDTEDELRYECEAVDDILEYSVTENEDNFLKDLSKVCTRSIHTVNREYDVSDYLFEVWSGESPEVFREGSSWISKLQSERIRIEQGTINKGDISCISTLYQYKISKSRSFHDALQIYNSAISKDAKVFGSLVSKAGEYDVESLKTLDDYTKYKTDLHIITRLGRLADSYKDAYELVNKYKESYENSQQRADNVLQLSGLSNLLGNLISNVNNFEQLDEALELMKKTYPLSARTLTGNMTFEQSQLTVIDILSLSSLSGVQKMSDSLFGDDLEKMQKFLDDRILPSINRTLANGFTGRHMIITIVSIIGKTFLENLNKSGIGYKTAKEKIFDKLQSMVSPDVSSNGVLSLRNSFVFAALFDFSGCKFSEARDVLYEYAIGDSDCQNSAAVTEYVLNKLLYKAVHLDVGSGYIREIDRFFNDFHVKKDAYTYNNLITYQSEYWEDIRTTLEEMFANNISPNNDTIRIVFSAAPSFADALSFLKINQQMKNFEFPPISKVTESVLKMFEDNRIKYRDILAGEVETWRSLFSKKLAAYQRSVVKDILHFMQNNHEYDNIYIDCLASAISNKTFMVSYEAVDRYLFEELQLPRQSVHSSIVLALAERLLADDEPRRASNPINKKTVLSRFLCMPSIDLAVKMKLEAMTLRLYGSHDPDNGKTPKDIINIFYDTYGTISEELIDSYLDISSGMDKEQLSELVRIITGSGFIVGTNLRMKAFRNYNILMDGDDMAEARYVFGLNAKIKNQILNECIIAKFKNNRRYSLFKTSKKLKGEGTSLSIALSNLLYAYAERSGTQDSSSVFHNSYNFYERWYFCSANPSGLIPNEKAILALTHCARSIDEIKNVMKLVDESGRPKDELVNYETYGCMLKIATGLDGIRKITELYSLNNTGHNGIAEVELIVKRLQNISKNGDDSKDVLIAICDHLFSQTGGLNFTSRIANCPFISILSDRRQVTSDIIHTLFKFLQQTDTKYIDFAVWKERFDIIFSLIIELYPGTLLPTKRHPSIFGYPMESLSINEYRIPYISLFDKCVTSKTRFRVGDDTILSWVKNGYVSDFDTYCKLLRALKDIGYSVIDDELSEALFVFLKNNRYGDNKDVKKLYNKVISYSKAGKLRSALFHPDIDCTMSAISGWGRTLICNISIDLSIKPQDFFNLSELPEAYFLSLIYLNKSSNMINHLKVRKSVKEYENASLEIIERPDVMSLQDVRSLPKLWQAWSPSFPMRRKILKSIFQRCKSEIEHGNSTVKNMAGNILQEIDNNVLVYLCGSEYIRDFVHYRIILDTYKDFNFWKLDTVLLNRLFNALGGLQRTDSRAKQVFYRIIAYSKADRLRVGFFHPDIDSSMKAKGWGWKWIGRIDGISRAIFLNDFVRLKKLPEAYILSLCYLQKSYNMTNIPEVRSLVYEYEQSFPDIIEKSELISLNDVLSLPYYWMKSGWKARYSFKQTIFKSIITRCLMEENSTDEKVRTKASAVIQKIRGELYSAKEKKSDEFRFKYSFLNEKFKTPNEYLVFKTEEISCLVECHLGS